MSNQSDSIDTTSASPVSGHSGFGAGHGEAGAVWDLDQIKIDPVCALRIPRQFAHRKKLLPLCQVNEKIIVAGIGPVDSATQRSLRNLLKCDFEIIHSSEDSLRRALSRVYERASSLGSTGELHSSHRGGASSLFMRSDFGLGSEGRLVSDLRSEDTFSAGRNNAEKLSDEIIRAAMLRSASDIHLVPGSTKLSVRLRVDGVLETYREFPMSDHEPLLNRLKVLAGMDVAENRTAQDGRIIVNAGPGRKKMEMRAACLPTKFGQRMTLRLLSMQRNGATLGTLGMSSSHILAVESVLRSSHGLVLITGPTGSGKSTTLLAAIEYWIKNVGGNVLTIEDPIEYEIEGASQVEVDSADKVNFAKALRSMLRHDPDVLMIGEIRDRETAAVAIQAALTGHLVFSTLHTATAAGAVTRMMDLGVDRFLLSETLRLVVSQRLVRRLCPYCRQAQTVSACEAQLLHRPELEGRTIFEPGGCLRCAGKGTVGRLGLFEILRGNELGLCDGASHREGPVSSASLLDDASQKVLAGETYLSEALHAAGGY